MRSSRSIRKQTQRLIVAFAMLAIVTSFAQGQNAGAAPPKAGTSAHKKVAAASSSSPTKSGAVAGKSNTLSASASRKRKTSRVATGKKKKLRGQQKIDADRVQAIQEALIREHYLTSEAAGTWNQSSEDAMRRYQADHGWQSKTVPDSRALIKLGLGPSHDHLLNPESAMTTQPDMPRAMSLEPSSNSADPGSPTNKVPTSEASPTRPQK